MSAPKYSVGQDVSYRELEASGPSIMQGKIIKIDTRPRYYMNRKPAQEFFESDIVGLAGGRKTRSRSRKHKRKTRKH
jgi:hypothetical protein